MKQIDERLAEGHGVQGLSAQGFVAPGDAPVGASSVVAEVTGTGPAGRDSAGGGPAGAAAAVSPDVDVVARASAMPGVDVVGAVANDRRPVHGAAADLVEVQGELATIAGALGRLRKLEWWRLSEESVVAATSAVEVTLRSGFGVQVRLATEIAERSLHSSMGGRSAAHLLAQLLRIPVGQAKGRLAAGAAAFGSEMLTGETIPPTVPELAAAIDTGAISDEHARVITTGVARIPASVGTETREMCHALLIREATVRDPIQLRRVAEQIESICNPDGPEPSDDAFSRMELTFGVRRRDGLTPIRGLLDSLTAEQLRVALEDLAAPRPVDEHTPDRRPAPVRMAQAFSEVIARYLAARGHLPDGLAGGGTRPVVAITIPAAVLCGATGRGSDPGDLGGSEILGRTASRDPGLDRVTAHFDYGGPVSVGIARMLACDGRLIRQVLGADSAVLDQGRAIRPFTRAQRRALITRDKGCAFPGCDIPAGWCEAHHVAYWSHGGDTDLDNGVLLCRRHHTVIHQEHWHIRPSETPRGRPWFVPPLHVDPKREPRRNTHFHLPEALRGIGASVCRT